MENNPKFLHYRYSGLNEAGQPYVYARGGVTFAYREVEPGLIRTAVAKCHLNDNFSKVHGRNKAGGRLESARFARDFKGTEQELLAAIDQDIANLNAYGGYLGARDLGLTLSRKFSGKRKAKVMELPASITAEDAMIAGVAAGAALG